MTELNPTPPEALFDPWNFRPDVAVEISGARLAGCKVEAIDGPIGKVVDASLTPDNSYLVVLLGRLFGRQVMLPAGTVNHVDRTDSMVYVDRSRDQVKYAPDVAAEAYDDPAHRDQLAGYYHATY